MVIMVAKRLPSYLACQTGNDHGPAPVDQSDDAKKNYREIGIHRDLNLTSRVLIFYTRTRKFEHLVTKKNGQNVILKNQGVP